MERKKVPVTAAQAAADSAVRKLRAAIYQEKTIETLGALLDIVLDTAKIAAREIPAYFSYSDLTERYGVSRKTIEAFGIPEHKFGGTVRFKFCDVIDWENAHHVE